MSLFRSFTRASTSEAREIRSISVRPQVGHGGRVLPADARKFHQGDVGKGQRERHEFVGLVAGVAEHHALVAGTLLFPHSPVDALCDVGALFVQGGNDGAGVCVEMILGLGVADAADGAAHHPLDVHVGVVRSDFAAHHGQTGAHKSLAGNVRSRILAEEVIENGVGNLVGHFVRMAFGYRFRREKIHDFSLFLSGWQAVKSIHFFRGHKGRLLIFRNKKYCYFCTVD